MSSWSLFALLLVAAAAEGFVFKRGRRPSIDGSWSGWDSWSQCYVASNTTEELLYAPWKDFSISYRNRSCSMPRPANGGRNCLGESRRFKQCGCDNPLGMANGKILQGQLSSTPFNPNFAPDKGRLTRNSVWCSSETINFMANIYYEVDLVNLTQVTRIALAGSAVGRVTQFKIRFSVTGTKWQLYKDSTNPSGVFTGNTLPAGVKSNTLQDGIVARYIRVYPTWNYGDVCMALELFGCVFTCGGVLYESSGEIKAQSLQRIDQSCMWKIEVAETTSITLDFIVVDLPCDQAWVEIRDGNFPYASAATFQRLCGDEAKLQKYPGNSLWVRFASNSSSSEVGFTLRYQTECNHMINLQAGQRTTIQSPNFPKDYYHNTECTWTITAAAGSQIEINFQVLDIEGSSVAVGSGSCQNDYVRVTGINHDGSQVDHGSYCNSHRGVKPIQVVSNKCQFTFKTDDAISGQGFKASISAAVAATTPVPTMYPKIPVTYPVGITTKVISARPQPYPTTTTATRGDKFVTLDNGVEPMQPTIPGTETSNNSSDHIREPKRRSGRDDQWTTILIGTFSGIILVMVACVLGMNLKKIMGGRETRTIVMSTPSYPAFNKKQEIKKPEAATPLLQQPTNAVVDVPEQESAATTETVPLTEPAVPDSTQECVEMASVSVTVRQPDASQADVASGPDHVDEV